jgi:response regulator NasT
MKALDEQVKSLEESLEVRKAVDRAKGILMDELGWKEHESFSWIQKTAMSERVRMVEVAERIINGDLRPEPPAAGDGH